MKCPECAKEGKRSRVSVGMSSTTCMGFQAYYDEDGLYHCHDPNITTTSYSCSEGHSWSEGSKHECQACAQAQDIEASGT